MNRTGRSFLAVLIVTIGAIMLILQPVLASTHSPSDTQSPGDSYGCDCLGRVGNVDCDYNDKVDIADLTTLIDHLFISLARLPNRDEANIDGDPLGVVDLSDLTALISHLFITLAELPECPKPPNALPVTHLSYPERNFEYINAVVPGLPAAGVLIQWSAMDIVDFPFFDPTFEFRWRVYGPYYNDASGVSDWDIIRDAFVKKVFLLTSGDVLPFGEAHTFIICDTVPVPIGIDSVTFLISCDTVIVDTVQESNAYGTIDTLFDVLDPAFNSDSLINRIVEFSWDGDDVWVTDTTDSLFNLFASSPGLNTESATFVFWIQVRDPVDSLLLDPTPAFIEFRVVDPKFERNVAVIDFGLGSTVNARIRDSARAYWQRAINNWRPEAGYTDSLDYQVVSQSFGNVLPLEFLLSYKVAILVGDDTKPGVLLPVLNTIFRAQDAGVSAWLMSRAPYVGGEGAPALFNISMPLGYPEHFGLSHLVYSGWDWHARAIFPTQRIEDFIGATSTQPLLWPDITIDSARLFDRYKWSQHPFPNRGVFPFVSTLGPDSNQFAMPEVDYMVPILDAEVMYNYNSLYGPNHFLGPQFSFHEKPVAIRLETQWFRSAHWLFTPYAFNDAAIQPVIDSMLNWLIESSFNAVPFEAGTETTDSKTVEGQ